MTQNLLSICSVCRKIKINNKWVGKEYSNYEHQIKNHNLTHGYCPACLNSVKTEIIRMRNDGN